MGGGPVKEHLVAHFGRPLNSYAPQFTLHSGALMREPSFRKAWYAVGFSSDVPLASASAAAVDKHGAAANSPAWHTDVKRPSNQHGKGSTFATRLWGEPLVLFRDQEG